MATLEILGIHPVEAEEPCFLVEVLVAGAKGRFDVGAITQADAVLPSADW